MATDALDLPIESFLDWMRVEKGRSPRTIASYSHDLASFSATLLNRKVSLLDAGPSDIDAHLAMLRTQGRSSASIARARSSVRGLYRFLTEEGEIIQDPSSTAAPIKVPSRLPKALSEEDATWLLESVAGDDPLSLRDRAILELLYGTGARVSEVVDLDLGDMNYDDGLLRLVGKGDKERLVPIGRAAQEALGRWLAPPGRPSFAEGVQGARLDLRALFLNRQGRRLSRQGIHLVVSERATRAGISAPVSPHALRHSCATHMLAHGADVRVVQELLGHASVATTQLYTKVSGEHLHAAYLEAHPRAKVARRPRQ
jgi:integrase/recombinase XerD